MKQGQSQLPVEADFLDPRSQDLDERHAVKVFLGKTTEQAEAMFRKGFLSYQEDLTYMRAPAFRFYVLPAISYLLSEEANGDSDAVSTYCHVLESRLKSEPEALTPIAAVVLGAVAKILARFDRFTCLPEIYGDVAGRYGIVAARLGELPGVIAGDQRTIWRSRRRRRGGGRSRGRGRARPHYTLAPPLHAEA